MRDLMLSYLTANSKHLGTFKLSEQLPWSDSNEPRYLNNKKHIYIDTPNSTQDPMFDALDHAGTVEEVIKVSVYFANDAKKLPAEYESVAALIKSIRTMIGTEGYYARTVNVTNSYVSDTLITHAEFTFKQLLTN